MWFIETKKKKKSEVRSLSGPSLMSPYSFFCLRQVDENEDTQLAGPLISI